nr:HrpB1 family type III secretion system apparatus protein [Robbsia betulipollinis]
MSDSRRKFAAQLAGASHQWRHNVLDLTSCPDNFVSALIDLLVTSVNKKYLAEAEQLLAALHVMRPRFRELHVYDVWLLMGRKRHVEAVQILRMMDGQDLQAPYGAYVSALMAICLYSLRDPSWQIFANEVLSRDEDAESVTLVNLLMGKKKEAAIVDASPAPAAAEVSPFSTAYFMRA